MRWTFLLALPLALAAAERAAYDSNGRIIALLSDAEDIGAVSQVVAVLPGGKRVPLQVRRDNAGAVRQGPFTWNAPFSLPDGGHGRLTLKSEETDSVLYNVTLTADSALEVEAIEFVLDLPRLPFLNGSAAPDAAPAVKLAAVRAAGPVLFRGDTSAVRFSAPTPALTLDARFDRSVPITLFDRWDQQGRSFQLRAVLARGPVVNGASSALAISLALSNHPPAPPPVHLTLDPSSVRFHFDGFGGNYCWNNASPISAYMLDNLKLAWARFELKAQAWDQHREDPGSDIKADLSAMRRVQQMGVPYVISVWWLPERLYTDPYEKPRSAHFRLIHPDRWNDLLDLLGSYLLYARREYGVEPDLFSFNEANIGVYVGQTPESHTEAMKRIGAHFRKLGLKTRMLLGDATGPRDTHRFVLDAAADPEALQYAGAVGFHSWGGGTPEQYAAWGDAAEWLGLPLLVTELGVDAAAYHTRSFDSYHYGLREARMTLELIQYARPQGTQFWQFTNDYALARSVDGKVEPTARFYLMKHFTDLTPHKSEALTIAGDSPSVLAAAFRKDRAYTIHILNLGSARKAALAGLPADSWRIVTTTETTQFQERPLGAPNAGALEVELPSRALVTLTAR
jgi:hypothetical protein